MFAGGDEANKSVSESLIRYYVSQGYNPAEIKDAYPAAPYGLIEQIAMEFGGVVNPGVQGRKTTGYTVAIEDGNPYTIDNYEDMPQAVTEAQFGNLLNQVPISETIVTGSPTGNLQPVQASPPSMPNEIQNVEAGTINPILDATFQGNYMGVNAPELPTNVDPFLSQNLLSQKIRDLLEKRKSLIKELGFPSADPGFYIPELKILDQEIESLKAQLASNTNAPSIDQQITDLSSVPEVDTELPTESEITGSSSTGLLSDETLTVRDKSTNSNYQLPPNFLQLIENGTLNGMTLYPIINNTNFEFSPDVQDALENFAKMDEPFTNLIGGGKSFEERRGSFNQSEDFGSGSQELIRKAGNLLEYPLRGIAGFLGELKGGARGKKEFLEYVPDMSVSSQELALARLLQIPGTKYKAPSVLGDTEGSVPLTTNEAIKQLQDQKPDEVISDETEAEEKATEGLDFSKYAPDLQERLDAELSDTSRITGQPTEQEQENINRVITNQGSFFSSPDWNEFLRNLGLGLSSADDMASGLVKGTALGSQAKALREAEALKAEQEERLELIKAGKADKLGIEDFEKIATRDENLAEQLRNFQKSAKNLKYIDEITGIVDGGGATGLAGFAQSWITKAVGVIGGGASLKTWDKLDPTTRARALLKVMQQTNIREILGESGRTISNLDRDIIKDVFGDITLTTTPAEILRKLEDSREGVMMSANETKGLVNTNLGFFKRAKINSSVAEQNRDLIKMIIQFDTNTYGSDYAKAYEEVDIDYRKQFKSSS